jgi:hypothetical protein
MMQPEKRRLIHSNATILRQVCSVTSVKSFRALLFCAISLALALSDLSPIGATNGGADKWWTMFVRPFVSPGV